MRVHLRDAITIRVRASVRYLGAVAGVVCAAPSVLGSMVFVFEPWAYPGSLAFNVVLASLFSWATYRWWTAFASAGNEAIHLRGFFRTLKIPTEQLAHVQEHAAATWTAEAGFGSHTYFVLYDHDGNHLGRIPGLLVICRDWPVFLSHLQRLASESRRNKSGDGA